MNSIIKHARTLSGRLQRRPVEGGGRPNALVANPARVPGFPAGTPDNDTGGGKSMRRVLVSLAAFVVMPTLMVAFYFLFVAADRYVSESHFVVRNAERLEVFEPSGMTMNLVRSFTGGGVSTSMQDAYVIVDYIRSRSIVTDVMKRIDLISVFGGDNGDLLTRLKDEPSLEELWEYWQKRVSTYVDINSGIVQLRVEAFAPDRAREISEVVIELSEELVNRLSDRSQNDALKRVTSEMQKAWSDYQMAENRLNAFRTASSVIDPVETAGAVGKVMLELYGERAKLQASLDTIAGEIDDDAPTARILRRKLEALNRQIDELDNELTGKENAAALSVKLAEFEQLQLDVLFKKNLYELTATSLEKARVNAEQQSLFLNVVVPPNVPEEALYPQRLFNIFFAFLSANIFWAIGSLMVAAVRDHM
ncbi:capsule polysaccharide transporter [Polymorphum gilvum]|uniref:Capsule polysaccharide export protein-like protein n=1 Tax=Polymorphum gilvum (strain LMG 25793 / CGMCC 1.9160 / SL003B-26A1) TaxID=991905 RepID=F2J3E3_POLGS|nr:capsule polysaccharide transporter [Polymorphum gilvum]ADZ70968.1 Capsule polysaccharide export protein-like protein [Polymorphum gilvum SL003B-26A1]